MQQDNNPAALTLKEITYVLKRLQKQEEEKAEYINSLQEENKSLQIKYDELQEEYATLQRKYESVIDILVRSQMKINETDNETVKLGNKLVFVNKRRITSAWIQSELKCSFGAVKTWLESNQQMLDKHHAKCNIPEHQNRDAVRALKVRDKISLSASQLQIKRLQALDEMTQIAQELGMY